MLGTVHQANRFLPGCSGRTTWEAIAGRRVPRTSVERVLGLPHLDPAVEPIRPRRLSPGTKAPPRPPDRPRVVLGEEEEGGQAPPQLPECGQ